MSIRFTLRAFLLVLLLPALVLLVIACSSNPAPPGLTPVPSLAPTVSLKLIDALPGQPTAASDQATAAATTTDQGTPAATEAPPEFSPPNCTQSNCTQNGPAITQNLKGDPASGQKIFAANCAVCHGPTGSGGVPNPGSPDQTVPSLNPIDPMFNSKDPAEFAKQLDLYVEHGSHTDGLEQMPNWGDDGALKPQQIADVIAYIMSLNSQ